MTKRLAPCFSTTHRHHLFLSDFSLHSIGVILFRRNQPDAFLDFCSDMVEPGRLAIIGLSVQHMNLVAQASKQFRLDFDDAYQYVTADKYNLVIVSFERRLRRIQAICEQDGDRLRQDDRDGDVGSLEHPQ